MRPSTRIFSDTPADIEDVLIELYRRMPAWRKVELVDDAIRTSRQLAMAGLRSRHPDEPHSKLQRRLAALVLGEQTADQVYGRMEISE